MVHTCIRKAQMTAMSPSPTRTFSLDSITWMISITFARGSEFGTRSTDETANKPRSIRGNVPSTRIALNARRRNTGNRERAVDPLSRVASAPPPRLQKPGHIAPVQPQGKAKPALASQHPFIRAPPSSFRPQHKYAYPTTKTCIHSPRRSAPKLSS